MIGHTDGVIDDNIMDEVSIFGADKYVQQIAVMRWCVPAEPSSTSQAPTITWRQQTSGSSRQCSSGRHTI